MSNKDVFEMERRKYDLKYPAEELIRFLAKNSQKMEGNKILGFGCGSGRNSKMLLECGYDVYAMDYADTCLELSREKCGEKVHYIKNHALDIPLEAGIMDCIVAWGALFLCKKLEEETLFGNLVKTLKPGGLLIADYRSKEDDFYGMGEEIDKNVFVLNDLCGSLAGVTMAFKEIDEIIEFYERYGVTVFNYEKKNYYVDKASHCISHYIIWAQKN